jgi:hypothetical protein
MGRERDAELREIPEDLVEQMVETLERESTTDWTREYPASGAKTTPS